MKRNCANNPHHLATCLSLCLFFLAGPLLAQDVTLLEEEAIQQVVKSATPHVVRIETVGGLESAGDTGGAGPTSGVIVSKDGYVVASAYPFAKMPSAVLVTLPDGQRSPGKIVATDHSRNLVLLKVTPAKPLTPAPAGKRQDVRVGQWAIAVGRVYSPERLNVSTGIISATRRIWGKAIQTDAKISPANYGGALLDIHGNVLGVLTPLSPQQGGASAGAEWYDSGIGFAAPLDDIYANLERWKKGDLHRGILGAAFGKDMYGSPAKVEAVRPKSPAKDAGVQVGDVVVEANGSKIQRMSQFRHAIGPLYADDEIALLVTRGEEKKQVKLKAKLVKELVPFEHAFFGVLPKRDANGVVVRWVYPDSPADKAGIQASDRIVAVDGQAIESIDDAFQKMAAFEPKAKAEIEYERDGKSQKANVTFAALPSKAPEDLPPAEDDPAGEPQLGGVSTGLFEVKIPEEASACTAYVPEGYDPRRSYGLMVLVTKPTGKPKELLTQWKELSDNQQVILLAPQPANKRGWAPPDVDFVIKTIDSITQSHSVDPARIAVFGETSGAGIGLLAISKRRDLVRGLIMLNGALPRGLAPPENEPLQRLAIYCLISEKTPIRGAAEATAKALGEKKFPVQQQTVGESLTDEQKAELVRWIDSLDRI